VCHGWNTPVDDLMALGLQDEVLRRLNSFTSPADRTVYVVGHSRGGALVGSLLLAAAAAAVSASLLLQASGGVLTAAVACVLESDHISSGTSNRNQLCTDAVKSSATYTCALKLHCRYVYVHLLPLLPPSHACTQHAARVTAFAAVVGHMLCLYADAEAVSVTNADCVAAATAAAAAAAAVCRHPCLLPR
jgi:hypothetical protein